MQRETHTIDANNTSVGRLATQVAWLLMGKHKPSYVPNEDIGDYVIITNPGNMKVTGRKMEQKIYHRTSGNPGGMKKIPMGEVFSENPGEVLKKAVWEMLPNNKLRRYQIKRLHINHKQ